MLPELLIQCVVASKLGFIICVIIWSVKRIVPKVSLKRELKTHGSIENPESSHESRSLRFYWLDYDFRMTFPGKSSYACLRMWGSVSQNYEYLGIS